MFYIALIIAKLHLAILKLFHKEKDDKPGFLAYKLCPNFLEKLNKPDIVIGITGTNGKTTTTNLLNVIIMLYIMTGALILQEDMQDV